MERHVFARFQRGLDAGHVCRAVNGLPVDFEQNKLLITQAYAGDLQKNVVIAERKNAKVEVKPMPKDLFPPENPVKPDAAAGVGDKAKAARNTAPKQ